IQQSGGSVLTGVTDTNGVATITVTGPGDYDVISVAGVDATSLAQGSTAGVTAAFAGRLMISNLVFTSTGGPPEASIGIQSSDPNNNELVLYQGSTTALTGGSFYGGPSNTVTSIGSISYLLAG